MKNKPRFFSVFFFPIGEREGKRCMSEDKKQEQLYFVFDVSGRKIHEFTGDHVIVHRNSIDAYQEKLKREEERELDQRGDYIQFVLEPNKALKDLTIHQRRYLMELMPYVQYGDNPLRMVDENGEIHRITNKHLSDIWSIHSVDVTKLMNKFVEKGFFKKIKDPDDSRKANYISTGLYFGKGNLYQPSQYTTKLFQNKLKEVIQEIKKIEKRKSRRKNTDRKQTAALGMIHAVLPFFHYQTYYLVKNPNENICRGDESVLEALQRNPKALKHISKAELCRLSNVTDNRTIDYYFKVLMEAGAIMLQHTKGKTRYKIHPDLMFRRDGNGIDPYTEFVREEFRQHD